MIENLIEELRLVCSIKKSCASCDYEWLELLSRDGNALTHFFVLCVTKISNFLSAFLQQLYHVTYEVLACCKIVGVNSEDLHVDKHKLLWNSLKSHPYREMNGCFRLWGNLLQLSEDIFCAKWLENYCAGALNNLAKQDITLRSELAVVLTDPRSSLSCFRAKLISWSARQIARNNMLFHSAIALLRHWSTRSSDYMKAILILFHSLRIFQGY